MDARFFSILGLIPGGELESGGLNQPESHRDDEAWEPGPLPSWLPAAEVHHS